MGRQEGTVTKALPMSMRRPPNPKPFRPRERLSCKARWGSEARGLGTQRGCQSRAGSTEKYIAEFELRIADFPNRVPADPHAGCELYQTAPSGARFQFLASLPQPSPLGEGS
jgi:hypothetical protein